METNVTVGLRTNGDLCRRESRPKAAPPPPVDRRGEDCGAGMWSHRPQWSQWTSFTVLSWGVQLLITPSIPHPKCHHGVYRGSGGWGGGGGGLTSHTQMIWKSITTSSSVVGMRVARVKPADLSDTNVHGAGSIFCVVPPPPPAHTHKQTAGCTEDSPRSHVMGNLRPPRPLPPCCSLTNYSVHWTHRGRQSLIRSIGLYKHVLQTYSGPLEVCTNMSYKRTAGH